MEREREREREKKKEREKERERERERERDSVTVSELPGLFPSPLLQEKPSSGLITTVEPPGDG